MIDVNGKVLIDVSDPIWRSGILDAIQTFFERKNIKFITLLDVSVRDYVIGNTMIVATKKQDK